MAGPSDNAAAAGNGSVQAEVERTSSQPTPTNSAASVTATLENPSATATNTPAAVPGTPASDSAPAVSASAMIAAPSEAQVTAPSVHTPEVPDVNAAPATTSASGSSTAASMLPRASSVSSGSTSSSGTATPTARVLPTRGLIPASTSNRSLSGSTARTTDAAQRPFPRPGAQLPSARERSAPFVAPRNSLAASAMTSTYAAHNHIPSIFGFYSHDANPTTQVSTANASTYQPPVNWRQPASRTAPTHHRAGSNSPGPTRAVQAVFQSPISSPRTGALSFYAPAAQRNQARSTFSSSTAMRSDQRRHGSQSAAAGLDSTLPSFHLPTEQPTFEETTTISFTWTIRDLHLLREEVELSPPPSEGGRSVSAGAGKSDVWTSHPVFGDNKWKLELVRTTRPLEGEAQAPSSASHGHVDDDEATPASSSTVDPMAIQDGDSTAVTSRSSITILSVYLTALVLDYTNADVEIPASIMLALRPVRAAVGRSGAESGGYLWRRFYDYTFQKEADLFTCHDLPSVSEMLQDSSVARDDAVTLSIQLGLGPGHTRGRSSQLDDSASTRAPIEVEGHHLVPRAMLDSLHGLLDDANTGDVRILVRERGVLISGSSDRDSMSDHGHFDGTVANDTGRIVPFPVGSGFPPSSAESETGTSAPIEDDPDRIFVRDRVLWAHASVLKSRSDYFKTMLTSDFSEGISRSYGDPEVSEGRGRNVRTLQISDADFVTAYWFLRYLYTDDIHFADQEDVRSAVLDEEWARGTDQGYLTAGSTNEDSTHHSMRQRMLSNWTSISQLKDFNDFEVDDETSYSLPPAATPDRRRDLSGSFVLQGSSLHTTASTSTAATTSGSLRQRTSAAGIGSGAASTGGGAGSARPLSAPNSPAATTGAGGAGKHHTADGDGDHHDISRASAMRTSGSLDPHEHPCETPGPASALSIYKLAHRYHMQDLSRLAALHMVATLTSQSAFPMLLATSMYEELHAQIKTYVYQHWHLVSHTQEFERCCDEVSVGMWGADAGKTMRAFVRSLVSPLRAAQG